MVDDTGPDKRDAGAGADRGNRFDRVGNGFAVAAIVLLVAVILIYALNL